ncbi:DedA family protein [Alicyclobacillus tolerans]|uniref:DedA family protein n=1 Tax=Alicyclobacillus tolerans TaxID=90970 RepID=UPI003B786DCE
MRNRGVFFIQHLLHLYGYGGLFIILLAEMIGFPFPAETTLTLAGVEWSQGMFSFLPLLLVSAFGNIAGSTIAYGIGYFLGRPVILRFGRWVGVTEARLKKAENKFVQYQISILLWGKFVSVIRVLVPYIAGLERMPMIRFSLLNSISAFLWAAVFLLEGRFLGVLWTDERHREWYVVLGIGIVMMLVVWWRWRTAKRRHGQKNG